MLCLLVGQGARAQSDASVDFRLQVEAARGLRLDTLPLLVERMAQLEHRLQRICLPDSLAEVEAARRYYARLCRRHAAGHIQVYQIYYPLPQNISARSLREAVQVMDSISTLLKHSSTDSLALACARSHACDVSICRIEALQVPIEYEEALHRLEVGEWSAPLYTPQGIYLAKVLQKMPMPPFESVRATLLERLRATSWWQAGIGERVETLMRTQDYRVYPQQVERWVATGRCEDVLMTYHGRSYTEADIALFASGRTTSRAQTWRDFVKHVLLWDAGTCLQTVDPVYAATLRAYQDTLLYTAVRQCVLHRPTDEELNDYYRKHASEFAGQSYRFIGVVLSGNSKKQVKRARKFLQGISREEWEDAIRLMFASDDQSITCKQGVFAPGDDAFVDKKIFKLKVPKDKLLEKHTALVGEKERIEMTDAMWRQSVERAFLNQKEREWIETLRKGGKVEIDQEDLKTVNYH